MPKPPAAARAGVHYDVLAAHLQAHLFQVTLTIAQPQAQQTVSLPVWIPGSYLVREFAKNLQNLRARQGKREVSLQQTDKHTWVADCHGKAPLVLTYEVCAYDNSVRTAWLDASRGFFNGTSLCLRVHGQEQQPHTLEVSAPAAPTWTLATGLAALKVDKKGFGLYAAAHYDELVDCPVEMGDFWVGKFTACGVPHRFVVAGAAPSFDGQRLLADTQKICETAIRFWHGQGKAPFTSYLFMLNAVNDGYGGLEHRNSTALICGRRDLPRQGEARQSEGYTTLLGLISHEYFHTWNVKRLRPAEFAGYDYDQENYTQLLWFFEGFTSYYDDLLLRRAGLIDDTTYLKLITKTINQVLQTPGRQVQTVAQASFDAWVKYYRQDENTPNATVSYYTKGSLVALCLDLHLRQHGKATLDDVMRGLWSRCKAGPMSEADLLTVLEELTGRSYATEIAQWVHSTDELPLAALLAAHGVTLKPDTAQLAQRLGIRVAENHSVQIKTVLRGSAAEQAGFAAGDEWLGLRVKTQAWRISKLDDVAFYAGPQTKLVAVVARDGRLLELPLTLPAAVPPGSAAQGKARRQPQPDTVNLTATDTAAASRWLGGAA
ncbi:M61 family metallopeptidase [Acidovorax temperans]|uniref:M61 family metallopeptidase n=1 Tax=Acidovorax temperans TaxID=80878 RepID=UPI001A93B596|nr:M61 family metallopeptidase [Acidovorax temperans]MBO0941229.1 M61 family metallopeptidase [Acidovorax temperans]WCT23430.1 M61 family metallopeptidase [Acidovorax temperans]